MTVHLCRDFLTQPNANVPGTNMYAMAIFLFHTMQFGIVGQVNFSLTSYRLGTFASSINQGLGSEYDVLVPSASYVVSSDDVGRIVAMRSATWPRHNSGLFRVQSVNTSSNVMTIDYRSNEFPPAESNISSAVFEAENVVSSSWQSGSLGINYGGKSFASASRIILSSPETLSEWQVRLTLETVQDVTVGAAAVPFSIAPGFMGNENGDFHPGVEHLHGALFHDTSASFYRGLTVGTGFSTAGVWDTDQWRINMICDSETGTTGFMLRSGSAVTTHWGCFGIPEDETNDEDSISRLSEEQHIIRLFVLGAANQAPVGSWDFDYQAQGAMNGVAWGTTTHEPVPCMASVYHPATNSGTDNQDDPLESQVTADNSPWTNATDLLDVEILAGTFKAPKAHTDITSSLFITQPRRVGRLPFFRHGRANYANWTTGLGGHFLSSSWVHSINGVFMEWGGPLPSDMVISSSVFLLEASSVSSSTGLLMLDNLDPGDAEVEVQVEVGKDIDAARFRKTYSYFRQEPRPIGFDKRGSSPQQR